MKSISAFILIFVLLSSHSLAVKVEEISELVQNLLESESVPTGLSAITCWSNSNKLHFLKASQIPIRFSSQSETHPRHLDEKTNNLWNFIDMRCSGSYQFLNNLDGAYFAQPYRWILFEPVEERLMELPFLTNSNVILINFNADLSRFDLKQGKYSNIL